MWSCGACRRRQYLLLPHPRLIPLCCTNSGPDTPLCCRIHSTTYSHSFLASTYCCPTSLPPLPYRLLPAPWRRRRSRKPCTAPHPFCPAFLLLSKMRQFEEGHRWHSAYRSKPPMLLQLPALEAPALTAHQVCCAFYRAVQTQWRENALSRPPEKERHRYWRRPPSPASEALCGRICAQRRTRTACCPTRGPGRGRTRSARCPCRRRAARRPA